MLSPIFRAVLVAAACGAAVAAAAQGVTPPPLPPGSNLVRPEAGMSEPERKRHVRAHHHKFHHKKDMARDDSVHGHESETAVRTGAPAGGMGAAPSAPGAGGGAAGNVQDGSGKAPAREKTDRGASSWFFGQPDNKK